MCSLPNEMVLSNYLASSHLSFINEAQVGTHNVFVES